MEGASLPPLDRAVARAAAAWLVRLRESPSPEDLAACARWCAAAPEHARAWQRAQEIDAKFGMLDAGAGMSALTRSRRFDRRASMKAMGVLVAAGPAAYLAYRTAPWRDWMADERTGTGERRSVVLADGTRVDLNTATAFDVTFNDGERRITLHAGEIRVATGRDAAVPPRASPLVVQTSDGRVQTAAARFVVRVLDEAMTRVAVYDGSVVVSPASMPDTNSVLTSGQQTDFTTTSVAPSTLLDRHAADWSRGVLFADGVRLIEFVAALSRYRVGVLRCDAAVADLRITGAFQIGNTDSILAALPDTLPVRVVYRTRYWVTIVADPFPRLEKDRDAETEA